MRVGSVSLSLFAITAVNSTFMTLCNMSPPRFPNIHNQQSLMLHWRSFSGYGRACVSIHFDHQGGQYIKNKRWCTNVNSLRLSVAYLNATINVKLKTQNQRLEPTGLPNPSKTRESMGMGPAFACQQSAGWVFGLIWNGTDRILQSKPELLVGYPDLLLTLALWIEDVGKLA